MDEETAAYAMRMLQTGEGLLEFVIGSLAVIVLFFILREGYVIRLWEYVAKNGSAGSMSALPLSVVKESSESEELQVRPLSITEWLDIVNNKPDDAPHALIVGNTGSGKTWLAQALAASRDGQVIILDPKWKPGKWGGAPAISIDDDLSYAAIEQACSDVLDELKQRQVALKSGTDLFTPLTVIVEELPTVLDECPTAPQLFKRLGQLGRELRIRVIGLSQSDRVKTLKLEGEGDARSNYTFIRLGEHAMKVAPAAATMHRAAALEWRGKHLLIDTSKVPTLVQQPIASSRWYQGNSLQENRHHTGINTDNDTTGITDMKAEYRDTDGIIEELAKLPSDTMSANQIFKIVGGNRNAVLAKVRAIRG